MNEEGGTLTFALKEVKVEASDIPSNMLEASPGNFVMVSISDTGEGISPEYLPHLFTPFFSLKTDEDGHGLGLSIVKSIIDEMKGFIVVKSELNVGTSFELYFH